MRKKGDAPLSYQAIEARLKREREVRDIYNKLRKRYSQSLVDQFFTTNYFFQPEAIQSLIKRADNNPVDPMRASITYKAVMKEGFQIDSIK